MNEASHKYAEPASSVICPLLTDHAVCLSYTRHGLNLPHTPFCEWDTVS